MFGNNISRILFIWFRFDKSVNWLIGKEIDFDTCMMISFLIMLFYYYYYYWYITTLAVFRNHCLSAILLLQFILIIGTKLKLWLKQTVLSGNILWLF